MMRNIFLRWPEQSAPFQICCAKAPGRRTNRKDDEGCLQYMHKRPVMGGREKGLHMCSRECPPMLNNSCKQNTLCGQCNYLVVSTCVWAGQTTKLLMLRTLDLRKVKGQLHSKILARSCLVQT
eukprot:1161529-Pelagomonas_calceolata.AAC.12